MDHMPPVHIFDDLGLDKEKLGPTGGTLTTNLPRAGFFSTYIKPIQGKLISIGIIIVLVVIVLNIFLKSLKKDHTLEIMQTKLEMKEQERKDILADRAVLEAKLEESKLIFQQLNKKDSLLQISIEQINSNIVKLKASYNEKIKVIEHFNSVDLQQYYHNLSNDY